MLPSSIQPCVSLTLRYHIGNWYFPDNWSNLLINGREVSGRRSPNRSQLCFVYEICFLQWLWGLTTSFSPRKWFRSIDSCNLMLQGNGTRQGLWLPIKTLILVSVSPKSFFISQSEKCHFLPLRAAIFAQTKPSIMDIYTYLFIAGISSNFSGLLWDWSRRCLGGIQVDLGFI